MTRKERIAHKAKALEAEHKQLDASLAVDPAKRCALLLRAKAAVRRAAKLCCVAALLAGCVNPYPVILDASRVLEEASEVYVDASSPANGIAPKKHARLGTELLGAARDLRELVEEAQ